MGVVCPSGLSEVSTAQASGTTHSNETRNNTRNAMTADGRIRRRRAEAPICGPCQTLIEPFTRHASWRTGRTEYRHREQDDKEQERDRGRVAEMVGRETLLVYVLHLGAGGE